MQKKANKIVQIWNIYKPKKVERLFQKIMQKKAEMQK